MRENNYRNLSSKKCLNENLPSTRFVEEVLKSLSWLSTGKYIYGHYFSCNKCTQWDMTYRVFRNIVFDKLDLWELKRPSDVELTARIRKLLSLSSKTFALSLLCEAKSLSENEYKKYPFLRKCCFHSCNICLKTGKKCSHQDFFCRTCVFNKFSTFFTNVQFLFAQKDISVLFIGETTKLHSAYRFAFFETKTGSRQPDSTKDPFLFPVMLKSLVKPNQFVVLVDKFLREFIPHLLYLNWTATQLKSITTTEKPKASGWGYIDRFRFQSKSFFYEIGHGPTALSTKSNFWTFLFHCLLD